MELKLEDKLFIGRTIKFHREKLKLTQAELAEMTDLSVQHLSRIENGNYVPSLYTFFILITVLKIDLRVFGYDVSTSQNPTANKIINKILFADDAELEYYDCVLNLPFGITKK